CRMSSPGGLEGNMTQFLLVSETFTSMFFKNLMVVLFWLLLSYINGSLVATFFRHLTFYEDPRYILFIHMVINDSIQLTVTITLFLLSYIFYRINVSLCCFFILVAVFTTRNTPVNLASMAIERYIAICEPLRHTQICTVRRTYIVIGMIWFICAAPDITDLFVTLATESMSFFHESVSCLRQNVFKDPILAQKRLAFDVIYFSCVFLTLVLTYLRILFAARALSTDKMLAKRARNTILLHGAQLAMCMLSYISPSVEIVLNLIFPGRGVEIRFANYLIVYLLPRLLSPIIYGVRDKKFRKYLKIYFQCNRCRVNQVYEQLLEMLNSSDPLQLLPGSNNSSSLTGGAAVNLNKEDFSSALTKNIVAMLVWLLLSVINGSMVHTFLKHRLFYENPRYIMFICMAINDALQLSLVTALYVVSYVFRKIHASVCCFLIMTAVLTTRSTPLILAGMALERYLSICFPMHYIHMCSVPHLLITVVHQPLSLFNTPIFCDHPLLFRHPSIYYKNCVFDGVYLSFVALTLLYTYCKIMLAAQAASTGLASVKRARNTVLLHGLQLLLCMLTFVVPSLQAALISLFPRFSLEIRYIFFLVVYIIPRFLSPVIYGFRDEQFRKYWTRSEDNMNSSRRFDSYNEAFTKNFITFVLVFTIICINGAFVYTYFKSKDFQRDPRYVLYIHLVINDMIMLTLSLGLMIATYTGNPGFIPCWIMLVVSMTTNRNSPLNLAGMAMERYIAVCLPHHVQICTVQRAHLLIALIWLTVLCHASFVYNTPYHVTLSLVVEVLLFSFVFLTVVLTYLNVLLAARGVSGVSRASMRNARNTILLHGVQLLLCLLSFIAPFINLFLVTNWPHKRTDIFFSTFVFTNILPRLLSPLIYGLRDKKFRANIRMHFCFKGCRTVEERMK
ncbi:hypothetical protein KUCAC02_030365, partial [Chaenocephalus aceratus]